MSHWYLAPCLVPVSPEEHRKIWSFLGDAYAELFLRPLVSGSHLCGVFYDPTVSCSEFAFGVQEYGFFWKTNSGMVSVFSTLWFDSGYMHGVSLRGLLTSTLQKTADSPQLQFIEGSRHPCLYADAVPHGPDCSENHRDSTVARRHDGRCPFRAGCLGSHVQAVGGTVVLPRFLLVEKIAVFSEDADIPIVMQRPILMVQRWTIEISQLQFVVWSRSLLSGRAGRSHPCRSAHAASHGPDSLSDHRYSPVADKVVDVPVVQDRADFPCRGADAVSHGPDCSSDHGVSTVCLRQGDRCPCCASRERSTGAVVEKTVELPRLHSFVDFVL